MNYRTLGKTGLQVSEVGYVAWGIAKSNWIGVSDDESIKALNKAFDLGLNFVDTALCYGEGHSKRLIGQVTKSAPSRFSWRQKFRRKTDIGLHNRGYRRRKPFPLSMSLSARDNAAPLFESGNAGGGASTLADCPLSNSALAA
jgi:predicted oxidoreductase